MADRSCRLNLGCRVACRDVENMRRCPFNTAADLEGVPLPEGHPDRKDEPEAVCK